MKSKAKVIKLVKMCGGKKCGSSWAGATIGTALNPLKQAA